MNYLLNHPSPSPEFDPRSAALEVDSKPMCYLTQMNGWMGGCKSRFVDCVKQKINDFTTKEFLLLSNIWKVKKEESHESNVLELNHFQKSLLEIKERRNFKPRHIMIEMESRLYRFSTAHFIIENQLCLLTWLSSLRIIFQKRYTVSVYMSSLIWEGRSCYYSFLNKSRFL